jgi:hypothetical protein
MLSFGFVASAGIFKQSMGARNRLGNRVVVLARQAMVSLEESSWAP